MLRINEAREVWWDVVVRLTDDDGKPLEEKIRVKFQLATTSEMGERNVEILPRKVKGWEGIGDADGNVLEFTPENLKRILEQPYLLSALTRALAEASTGAARGN